MHIFFMEIKYFINSDYISRDAAVRKKKITERSSIITEWWKSERIYYLFPDHRIDGVGVEKPQ